MTTSANTARLTYPPRTQILLADRHLRRIAQGRPIDAGVVARTFLFLASERYSGSTHGQVLHVDGGRTGTLAWTEEEALRRRQVQMQMQMPVP